MTITQTLYVRDRTEWRAWLTEHHLKASEIWLLYPHKDTEKPRVSYPDAVEEALCFGWIDGIQKKYDEHHAAQRFTPRRPKSNWTELNKERCRKLIAAGLMTEAGLAKLPDLNIELFKIPPDILALRQADPVAWGNFQNFPATYQRVRIGYIEEQRRNPIEFEKRLNNFLKKNEGRENVRDVGITHAPSIALG
jgi:uncharacterized protein YdeI (YjbR/CyaY-like superfamily)